MKRRFFLSLSATLVGLGMGLCLPIAEAAEPTAPQKVIKSKYQVGQMWSYKARKSEKGSTFLVLKIENDGKYDSNENIIHIAVQGLNFKNGLSETGFSSTFVFLPIYEFALDKGAKRLLKSDVALPDYNELYQAWREPRDKGVGGAVFTVPVTECITLEEEAVKNLAELIQEYKKENTPLPQWAEKAVALRRKQVQ